MKSVIFLFLLACIGYTSGQQFVTPYEISNHKRTATYDECVNWYRSINKAFPTYTYFDSIGLSDAGVYIYVFRIFKTENEPKLRVLINNNIHPGEPEGTDASMLLVRDILTHSKKYESVLKNIDLHIICQYNVDGTLNQSCCTRANQDGPENMGFRGNARNLDLNRDFIKMDSRNANAFVQYFTKNNFHLFIDNHTSDGADYQYTLTYFHTRPEKLNPGLAGWLMPFDNQLKTDLNKDGIPHAPYVETIKTIPDSGIFAFWESGRFATGFAALHHCIGYCVETHMLKPFDKRMEVTLAFMQRFLLNAASTKNAELLVKLKSQIQAGKPSPKVYTAFTLDTKKADSISFLGFEASYKISPLTGMPRLFYDQSKPFKKNIPYYHSFKPTDSIATPGVYFIPFAWHEVAEKLQKNGIVVKRNLVDTQIVLRVSYIMEYETVKNPYEGHYLHYGVHTRDTFVRVHLRKGDYMVPVTAYNQSFLAAVLEPRSADSYFNWNIFDAVLQQKEGFSDYVWVDKCEQILENDAALKKQFETKKAADKKFAESASDQLVWIYKHSVYYERTPNLYPVYRLDN